MCLPCSMSISAPSSSCSIMLACESSHPMTSLLRSVCCGGVCRSALQLACSYPLFFNLFFLVASREAAVYLLFVLAPFFAANQLASRFAPVNPNNLEVHTTNPKNCWRVEILTASQAPFVVSLHIVKESLCGLEAWCLQPPLPVASSLEVLLHTKKFVKPFFFFFASVACRIASLRSFGVLRSDNECVYRLTVHVSVARDDPRVSATRHTADRCFHCCCRA